MEKQQSSHKVWVSLDIVVLSLVSSKPAVLVTLASCNHPATKSEDASSFVSSLSMSLHNLDAFLGYLWGSVLLFSPIYKKVAPTS